MFKVREMLLRSSITLISQSPGRTAWYSGNALAWIRKLSRPTWPDTSGARPKPIPGSNPQPLERISFLTHENLLPGLLQDGLGPAADRFENHLASSLRSLAVGHEWMEQADLVEFFEKHVGSALIRTLFGEELLALHPGFVEDLWECDKGVMNLARRLPRFWIPRTYHMRDKLLATVKKWHLKASAASSGPASEADSQTDPIWGTKMMKERYSMLLSAAGQDEASVASTDLAPIWAYVSSITYSRLSCASRAYSNFWANLPHSSVTNVVPSSMTLALHIFRSPALLSSLRSSLSRLPPSPGIKDLESIPLLMSMYAGNITPRRAHPHPTERSVS